MTVEDWLSIISFCVSVGVPTTIFFARHWLLARISRSVQHGFDVKLEELRAELRKQEELLRSELRDKEAEISTLRNNVLSGSASRQALLDKRRFEAVEKVWTEVNDLGQLKAFSAMMAMLNIDAVAKLNDEEKQQFLSVLGRIAPNLDQVKNVARDERAFLPESVWAYFATYKMIIQGNAVRFMILKSGADSVERYLSNDAIKQTVKAALPHQKKWIEEHEPQAYHYLLEEIETCLLTELRKVLEGKEVDESTAMRSRNIMEMLRRAENEKIEKAVADARDGRYGNFPTGLPTGQKQYDHNEGKAREIK
jgi:hypothetical protein